MGRLVEMKDTAPLVLRREDLEGNAVAVCRCGLSAAWPFCDGSHAKARDEEPGRLYAYTREAGELRRRPVDGVGVGEADPRKGVPPREGGEPR